jgi:hypothetical protein
MGTVAMSRLNRERPTKVARGLLDGKTGVSKNGKG